MSSTNDDETVAGSIGEETGAAETAVAESEEFQLSLAVDIEDAGPCKKHIRVKVPRSDIDHYYKEAVGELLTTASVPGFRVGHVPKKLVERRFHSELSDQVKQKVMIQSLEQLAEDNDLDPINEPNIDIENLDIPEAGDFEFEFDVEVRPEFELPDYDGLVIDRPVRDVTDDDVDNYLERFLSQYGQLVPHEEAAQPRDYVTTSVEFEHDGKPLNKLNELTVRLMPVLHFQDAELDGFDEFMAGVSAGETRETDLTISHEAKTLEMRGETVHVRIIVHDVKRMRKPELTKEFLQRVGVDSEDGLRDEVRDILNRQVTYEQRQTARQQVLKKITESADWDLPEQLVQRQVENALRREILEMQQAGFTTQQIRARENELRQHAISTTRQALMEHFVLDKIAVKENIEVQPGDIEKEIVLMAMQRGEPPRRVRAKLTKSGMIENLEAQIRERKAVDVILERANFNDVEMDTSAEDRVEAVPHAVCGNTVEAATPQSDEVDEPDEGDD